MPEWNGDGGCSERRILTLGTCTTPASANPRALGNTALGQQWSPGWKHPTSDLLSQNYSGESFLTSPPGDSYTPHSFEKLALRKGLKARDQAG